jgi:CRP/FNR family transcriptional regulator
MINIHQDTKCVACKRKCESFKMLNEQELLEINKHRFETHFNAGEIIFKQNMPATSVVIVSKGIFKLQLHLKNKRSLILTIDKGPALIGTPGTFVDNKYTFTLAAMTNIDACIIDTAVIKQTLRSNSEFADKFISECSQRSMHIYNRAISLTQKQMHGRLAEALLFFSSEIYNSKTFTLPMSRQDLADYTGMTKESACKILKQLKEDKTIEFTTTHFKILDNEKLEFLSEFG